MARQGPYASVMLREQGNDEDMLPESLLGTIRLNHLELSVAPFLDVAARKARSPLSRLRFSPV